MHSLCEYELRLVSVRLVDYHLYPSVNCLPNANIPQRGRTLMSYPAGGNFLRLHCGVKQWVYTSVATKLCCTVALLCGAVLLCYCSSPVLELQHELLHHGVDPRGDTAGMCATWLPWPFSRTYLHRRAWRSRRGGCHFFDQVYKQIVTGVVLGMQCAIAAGQYPVRVTSFLHSRRRAGPAGPQSA